MSILQFEIEGARVLDLFAGSGQMGIEALSRGALSCTFVDHARASGAVIRDNLERTGLAGRAKVVGGDVIAFLHSAKGPFDIAFVDPPYDAGALYKSLKALEVLISPDGAVLCESRRDEEMPDQVGALQKRREYPHGKTKLTLYRSASADEAGEQPRL